MFRHAINLLLVGGILWGAIDFYRSSIDYWPVRNAYAPIASAIRRFAPGNDPNKFYVRCMVNKPLHLEWRFSVPAGIPPGKEVLCMHQSLSGGGVGRAEKGAEHTAAWALDVGQIEASLACRTGNSGTSHGVDLQIAEFMQEHWDELEIQTLGLEATESVSRDQVVTLRRIDIPPSLQEAASPELASSLNSPIMIVIGVKGISGWDEIPVTSSMQEYLKP